MSLVPVVVIAHVPNVSPSERIYIHVYFSKSSDNETLPGVPITKAKESGIYVFRFNVSPFVPFAIKLQRWTTVKTDDRPSSPSSSPLSPDCASRAASGDGKKESITVLEWQARRIVVEKSWTVIFIEWDQPTRKLLLLSAGDPRYLFAGKYPVQKFPLETSFFVRSSICNWNSGPRLSEVHEFPPGSGIFWSWLFGSLNSVNEYKMVATIGGNALHGNRTIVVWEPLPFRNKALRANIPETFYLLFSDWGDYTDEYKAIDMKKSIIYDSHEEAIHSFGCTTQNGANPVSIWNQYLSQLAAASAAAEASSSAEQYMPMQTVSQASLVTVESTTGVEENELVFCSSCQVQDLREEIERLTRTMEGPGTEVRDTGLLLLGGPGTASCPSGECSSVISNSKDDAPLRGDELEAQLLASSVEDGFGAPSRAADAEMEGEEMLDFVLDEMAECELLGDSSDDAANPENCSSVEDMLVSANVGPDPVQEMPGKLSKPEISTEDKCQDAGILSKCTDKLNLDSLTEDSHSRCLVQDTSAIDSGISEPFLNRLKIGDELKMTPHELDELIEEFASATEAVQLSESELMELCQKIIDKRRDGNSSEVKLQEFDRVDNDDDEYEYEDDDDDYDKPFKRFETYYNRLKTIEEEADNLDESSSPERSGERCSPVSLRSFLTDTNSQKKEDTKSVSDDETGERFALEDVDYNAVTLDEASDKLNCVATGTLQDVLNAESGFLNSGDARSLSGHRAGLPDDVDSCSPYSMPATPDVLSSSEQRAVQTVMERYPCDERSFKTFRNFLRNSQTETASYRQCIDRSLLRDIIPYFDTGDDGDDDDNDLSGSCLPGEFDRFAGTGGEINGPFDSQQEPTELRGVTATQLKCFEMGVELYPTDEPTICNEDSEEAQLEYESVKVRVEGEQSVDADADFSAELAACEDANGLETDCNNSRSAARSKRPLMRSNSGDGFVIRGEDIDRLDGVEEVKVFRPCVFLSNRFVGQEMAYCASPPPPNYAQFEDSGDPDDSCHVTRGGETGILWSVREKKLDNADDYVVNGVDGLSGKMDDQLFKSREGDNCSPVDKEAWSRNNGQDAWKCLQVTEDESSAEKVPKDLTELDPACEDTPNTRSPVLDLPADSTYDESFETCRSDISEPDTEEREVDREELSYKKEKFFRVPKCVLNGIVNYESDYDSDTASKFPTEDSPDSNRMFTRASLKKRAFDDSRQFMDDSVDRTADDKCIRDAGCYGEDRRTAVLGTGDACSVGSEAQCVVNSAVCPDSISPNEKYDPVGEKSLETNPCHQDLYCADNSSCDRNSTPFEDDWYLDESEDKIRSEFRRRRLEEILAADSKFREILEKTNFQFSFNQSMDYMLDVVDEETEKSAKEDEEEDEEKLDVPNFTIFPADTMDFVLEDFDECTGSKKNVDSSVENSKESGSTEVSQWDDYMNRPPSPFADDWYTDPGQNSFTAFLQRDSSAAFEDLVRKRAAMLEQYHDSVLAGTSAISRRLSVYTTVPGQEELELQSESTFLRGTSNGDQIKRPCEDSCEPSPGDNIGKLENPEISEAPGKEACNGEDASSIVITFQEESMSGICERDCIQDYPDVSDSLQDGGRSSDEGDSKTNSSAHLSVDSSKSACEQVNAEVNKDEVSESSICSEDIDDPCPMLVPASSNSELADANDLLCQFVNIDIATDHRRSSVSMLNNTGAVSKGDSLTATDVTAGFLVKAAICKAQDNIHAKVEYATNLSTENQMHDGGENSEMENLRKEEEPENKTETKTQTV